MRVSLGGGSGRCICVVLVLVDCSDGVISVCCTGVSVVAGEVLVGHLLA